MCGVADPRSAGYAHLPPPPAEPSDPARSDYLWWGLLLLAPQVIVSGLMLLLLMGLSMTLDCYDDCPGAYRRVDLASIGLVVLGGVSVAAVAVPRLSGRPRFAIQASAFALAVLIGLWGLGTSR